METGKEAEAKYFAGCVFAFDGNVPGVSSFKRSKWICDAGGDVSFSVSEETTHLISNAESVQRGSGMKVRGDGSSFVVPGRHSQICSQIKMAKKRRIPICSYDFVSESVKAGKKLPEASFLLLSYDEVQPAKKERKHAKVKSREIRLFVSSTFLDMKKEVRLDVCSSMFSFISFSSCTERAPYEAIVASDSWHVCATWVVFHNRGLSMGNHNGGGWFCVGDYSWA